MTAILYDVPAALASAVASKSASIVGAVIKDNATGLIIGHMQQVSGFAKLATQAFGGLAQIAPGGFSPLHVVALIQNEQIKSRLAGLQESMALLQNLQYGALALSGLGIGVSIAGFAVMHRRLQAIEDHLGKIEQDVGQITALRRDDELRNIFYEIAADLQQVDMLSHLKAPAHTASTLQLSLNRNAHRLQGRFQQASETHGLEAMPLATLEQLWSLAATARLCHEAVIQALFNVNELAAARKYAEIETARQMALLRSVAPDSLSRLVSRSEKDPFAARDLRKTALQQARHLSDGIRGNVLSLTSQTLLAQSLEHKNISGRDFLIAAREEEEKPLMYLPV